MNSYLTDRYAAAWDRQQEHLRGIDPLSMDDLLLATPLQMEATVSQWIASLDIKTRHEMLKSSIDGIR
jgi:hypothetical protein